MSEGAALGLTSVLLATALVLGLAPVPELGFILQMFGLGGAVGLVVAYRARRLGIRADPWLIAARWSLLGGLLGCLFSAAALL